MRIDRLDLIAFGPFTDAVLDLSGGAEGLHLVYGPNEAGKSSALRAIKQFFGRIPNQSTDNFVHKHADMRIGMVLRGRDGSPVELVRRKGIKNTLLGPDDAEARLDRMLGGVSPDEFLRKFVIDHGELIEGGRGVVEGRGDLGQVLFSAGSGFAGLGAVRKALDEQAEALFKRGGSRPAINAALAALEAERKRIKNDTLRSSDWLAHDEALRDALARKTALERELEGAVRERNRLTRLHSAVGPIARRKAALDELAGLAGVPLLPANFTYRRKEALSYIQVNEKQESDALRALVEVDQALESLDVPGPLLDQAGAIEDLHLRLGRYQQSARDRDRIDAERGRVDAEARALLRDLGVSGGDPGRLRLTAAERAAVQDLAGERQALARTRDALEADLKAHAAKRSAAADKLAALGPERDPAPLRKAVKQAQALGPVEARRDEGRRALARDERRADEKLAALGLWSGPLDAVERLAVPTAERIELFRDRFSAGEALEDDLRRKADDLDAQTRLVDARLEELRLAGDVPTEDALAEARARRDDAWRRLKQARTWNDADGAAFEAAAARADDLADRLRREAGRVSDRARFLADRARLDADRDALRAQVADARSRLEQTRAEWAALWEPLGIASPWPPREMIAWLRRHAELAALAGSIREAREAVDELDRQIDAYRSALAQALASAGAPTGEPDEPLADLIERAEAVADALAEASSTCKRLAKDVEALDLERPALEDRAAAARAEWSRWEARWADAMSPLNLPADALTAQAHAVLNKTAELFDRLDKAGALAASLDELDRESARFTADVRALAGRVAPDLLESDTFDPGPVAAELYNRLTRARADREKRDGLVARRLELAQTAAAAGDTIAEMRGRLAALCREARCPDEDDLPDLEVRSARRQTLEKELADQNARLLELAAGASLDAFLAEADRTDPDGLPPRIDHMNAAIASLERERGEVDQAIGREKAILSLMDGGPKAADAGQEAESLRARIKEDVEQYARLRLASAVLKTGIERYREKVQGPVLARASALFAALTLGSFEGLRVDYDEKDEPVLKGVRPGGREALGVESMSLGTADQLYLALRLAALEVDLDRREPLPLVVDDILIQFDDARAAATLAALAALSRRTQVLVFTHHRHLLDLASSVVPPPDLITHTLPGHRLTA